MSMIMASIPIVSPLLQESALCNGDSVLNANYTEHGRSVLCDIDPDLNYYYHNNSIKSEYYTEKLFNYTFSDNNNLSILHLNIRSVSLHFSEFMGYLDTLDLKFKIIALSETGINNHHAVYNITHYHLEMDHRHKRRGGGVSLYIHNILQYKIQKNLVIGNVVNSVCIEIIRSSTNTKQIVNVVVFTDLLLCQLSFSMNFLNCFSISCNLRKSMSISLVNSMSTH